jgi:shikimate kinase
MKIVLIGYMSSGKSTIGKHLADKLFLPFIDLDIYIEKKEKKSVSDIFKNKGEIYFRLIEHKYLKEILISDQKVVLSLGGGTPCYADNMNLINTANTISFYLQTSIKVLVDRLTKEKDDRPLIASLEDNKISEFVAKHLFERRVFL